MKKLFLMAMLFIATDKLLSQSVEDTTTAKWSTHFQSTIIAQKHAGFHAQYSGQNSIADSVEPTATSLTGTLFFGRKLWKGAAGYFNPEVSGGKGLSYATGVAGALNGETYRVGQVAPAVFIARAYLQQHFALPNSKYEYVADDVNQVASLVPTSRITISAGKFAIADFFDNNSYSKDPRTQFFNWSIWANGAWDYPANTRGYTFGVVAEIIKPEWAFRVSSVAVPRIANFHLMEYKFSKANSLTMEFEHNIHINKRSGVVRLIASSTRSQAVSYKAGLAAIAAKDTFLLDVIRGSKEHRAYGGKKFAIGLNLEQEITDDVGFFSRVGWNDGKYATWAFTEIDRSANLGFSIKGTKWKRPNDVIGIAAVANVISKDHRNFLAAGGYGFIIGDGQLSYRPEKIVEFYYNAALTSTFSLTFDYQYVQNPAYNHARGPVNAFGLRGHIQI